MAMHLLKFNNSIGFIPRALLKLHSLWIYLMYSFYSRGSGCSLFFSCDLRNTHRIKLGNDVNIQKDVWLHVSDYANNNGEPILILEDSCFVGRRSHISAKNRILIERDVVMAAPVLIEDHGRAFDNIEVPIMHHGETEGGRIKIGQGCWIGQNAVIICDKGDLILGRNCVVAANAVVNRSAPPYSVLLGNPARIVKQYNLAKGAWILGSTTDPNAITNQFTSKRT
jgi:acetyltransferase-like isoleucine patch superfamily enzyme